QAQAADHAPPSPAPTVSPDIPPQPAIAVPAVPKVPPPPEDPRLAQVYAIFDGACAQCHQSGKLTRPFPAGGLANILDLERVSREPQLVRS
ncbi:hypothetical protein ACEWAJ_23905, partial [Vibrio parahaemolyticus]